MNTTTILGHCASVLVIAMLSARRTRRRKREKTPIPPGEKLAGVPLSQLLDDPCGPGSVLRDVLSGTPRGDGRE
ncbi:MAG: hypothetical protein RL088_1161 [Verrucomicrobiota bacterium]|jgi:hypothetical protein